LIKEEKREKGGSHERRRIAPHGSLGQKPLLRNFKVRDQ